MPLIRGSKSAQSAKSADPISPAILSSAVAEHMGLAYYWANKARLPRGMSVEEAESGAMLGLMEAIQRFDPMRGTNFSTFATAYIRGRIRQEARTHRRLKARQFLVDEEGCDRDIAADPVEHLRAEDRQQIQQVLAILSPRTRDIINRYYGLTGKPPQTTRQIGKEIGICTERVNQLRRQGLIILRAALDRRARGLKSTESAPSADSQGVPA